MRALERLLLTDYGFDSFDNHNFNMDVHYQWVSGDINGVMAAAGWKPVPAARYSSQFKITGNTIEHGGCVLMEKTRLAVEQARGAEIAAARNLVSNWKTRYAEFSPQVRMAQNDDYFMTDWSDLL